MGLTRNSRPAALLLAPAASPAAQATGVDAGGIGPLLIGSALVLVAGLLLARHAAPFVGRLRTRRGRRRLRAAVAALRAPLIERCILPGIGDGLARIDCAVLTPAGIVCIRALHLDGTVFGADDAAQWNRVDGVERSSFLNPLIQNEGRIQALRRVAPGIPVTGAVVFTGRVDFAVAPPAGVLRVAELTDWLARYVRDNPAAADPEAAWFNLRAVAQTDAAAQRDFDAQLSFG